jgi:hypothetical protein
MPIPPSRHLRAEKMQRTSTVGQRPGKPEMPPGSPPEEPPPDAPPGMPPERPEEVPGAPAPEIPPAPPMEMPPGSPPEMRAGVARARYGVCSGRARVRVYRLSINTRSFPIHIADLGKSMNLVSSSMASSIARAASGTFAIVIRSARLNQASAWPV